MSIYFHKLLHLVENIEIHGSPMATWLFSQERLNKDLIRSAASANPRRFGLSVALQSGDYVAQTQTLPSVVQADWAPLLTRIAEGEQEIEFSKAPRVRYKRNMEQRYQDALYTCYAEYHGLQGRILSGDLVELTATQGEANYFIPEFFLNTNSGIVARVRQRFKAIPHPNMLAGHQVLEKIQAGGSFVHEVAIGQAVCCVPTSGNKFVVCDAKNEIF